MKRLTRTIRSYNIRTLPKEYFGSLYRLNYGSSGLIRDELIDLKQRFRYNQTLPVHKIFVVLEENFVIAWGICVSLNDENTQFRFQCYVRKKFRKQGIGKKLLRKNANFIKKYEKRVICQVYPHSTESSALYKNQNILFLDDVIPAKTLKKNYKIT